MDVVNTIEEIRHARLLRLLEQPQFPTIQSFANLIERSHAQVSQWKTRSIRRNKDGVEVGRSHIDSASARWIEERAGLPRGWMDSDPSAWPFSLISFDKIQQLPPQTLKLVEMSVLTAAQMADIDIKQTEEAA